MPCYAMLYYALKCYALLAIVCPTALCYGMLYYALLCYEILGYALQRCAMLYYALI